MPKMNLSHFEAAFLFSLFASVVMGVVTKRTDRDRLHYGVYTFGCFLLALFGTRLADVFRPRLNQTHWWDRPSPFVVCHVDRRHKPIACPTYRFLPYVTIIVVSPLPSPLTTTCSERFLSSLAPMIIPPAPPRCDRSRLMPISLHLAS